MMMTTPKLKLLMHTISKVLEKENGAELNPFPKKTKLR